MPNKQKKIPKRVMAAALKETRKKSRLAKDFKAPLLRWYASLIKDFAASIKGGGQRIKTTAAQKKSFTKILKKHYYAVIAGFSLFDIKVPSFEFKKSIPDEAVLLAAKKEIAETIRVLIEDQAPERVKSIFETTESDKEWSLKEARALSSGDEDVSNLALAAIATRLLKGRFVNRANVTAISETNFVAEGTRAAHVTVIKKYLSAALIAASEAAEKRDEELAAQEAATAQGLSELTYSETAKEAGNEAPALIGFGIAASGRLKKQAKKVIEQIKGWVSMGDKKVRPTHRSASGQSIPDTKPFSVGGSLLMFPGDGSLGAATKELVRCRCYVYYF